MVTMGSGDNLSWYRRRWAKESAKEIEKEIMSWNRVVERAKSRVPTSHLPGAAEDRLKILWDLWDQKTQPKNKRKKK